LFQPLDHYLAFHAVQPMAAELGAEIAWKPILVGGRVQYGEPDRL